MTINLMKSMLIHMALWGSFLLLAQQASANGPVFKKIKTAASMSESAIVAVSHVNEHGNTEVSAYRVDKTGRSHFLYTWHASINKPQLVGVGVTVMFCVQSCKGEDYDPLGLDGIGDAISCVGNAMAMHHVGRGYTCPHYADDDENPNKGDAHGIVLEGTAGIGGGKVGIGYGFIQGLGKRKYGFMSAPVQGGQMKVSLLQTWENAEGTPPNQTWLGLEGEVTMFVKFGIGFYVRQRGNEDFRNWLFTYGVGAGF